MDEPLRQSMEAAMDANVTGTPAWLLDGRLLIPGAQSRDLYEIWVQRLRERDP
jgi:predicted DsbA family dithiol-disulfide isomerase